MPKEETITILDVGSSKFTAVVAAITSNKISVVGTYTTRSKGIKEGVVNNIDKAVEAISEVINKVEMMSGHPISKAIVTVSGSHIESLNSHGVVAVSGEDNEITEEDVNRVNDAAKAVSLPSNREIIHVIPREFIVDRQKSISNPVGMSGMRLEVESNVIHGASTIIKNLSKCIQQVGIDVDNIIYSGFSSGEVVLTETEKKLGSVLLDIGGGTVDIIVYTDGSPVYSAVLPIGGQDITNDLAIGLRTLLEDAEKIKIRLSEKGSGYSKDILKKIDGHKNKVKDNELFVGDMNIGTDVLSKKYINEIIERKLMEFFKFVQIYLKKSGYDNKIPSGIVITGGSANIKGIEKIAELVFKLPARVGKPSRLSGLVDQIQGPAYSSVVGAIDYFSKDRVDMSGNNMIKNVKIKGVKKKIISFVKSFLP